MCRVPYEDAVPLFFVQRATIVDRLRNMGLPDGRSACEIGLCARHFQRAMIGTLRPVQASLVLRRQIGVYRGSPARTF